MTAGGLPHGLSPEQAERWYRLVRELVARRDAGAAENDLLVYLRAECRGVIEAIGVLKLAMGIPLREAHEIVVASGLWDEVNGVVVRRAEPQNRLLIEGFLQFYIYDFSEFEPADSDRFELNAEHRFDPYPLDDYWRAADHYPLIIEAGGRAVGFALINAVAHSGGVCDYSMAEFFVMRKHRRGGVGARAAAAIVPMFPGRWEIAIARRNAPALGFWPRAVGALDCVRGLRMVEMDSDLWRGPILQFEVVG